MKKQCGILQYVVTILLDVFWCLASFTGLLSAGTLLVCQYRCKSQLATKNFKEKKEYRLDILLYNNVTINAFEFKFSRWETLRNLRAFLCFKIDWTCSLFLLLLHLLFMFLKFALHGGKLPPKFMWNTKRRQWRVIHSYSEWCYWNVSIPNKIVKSHYIPPKKHCFCCECSF